MLYPLSYRGAGRAFYVNRRGRCIDAARAWVAATGIGIRMTPMSASRLPSPPHDPDPGADRSPAGRRRWKTLLASLGLVILGAALALGFAAYFSPGLLLNIENLRLCF